MLVNSSEEIQNLANMIGYYSIADLLHYKGRMLQMQLRSLINYLWSNQKKILCKSDLIRCALKESGLIGLLSVLEDAGQNNFSRYRNTHLPIRTWSGRGPLASDESTAQMTTLTSTFVSNEVNLPRLLTHRHWETINEYGFKPPIVR